MRGKQTDLYLNYKIYSSVAITKNNKIYTQKKYTNFFFIASILGAALNIITVAPASASPTVGTGVLLFNYSDVTANVAETSNPSPYCVNNQGQIPQPMTVGPGNINSANTANQDVEFTAQSTGASCRLLYRNELTDAWQYPFNLYFSSGQPAITYTFGTSPPINNPNQCAAGYTVGNLVGIYQGMSCVWDKVEGFYWFYYLNNTVLTTFPPGASYYYTMTSLAGPSGENVPTGVPPTITGSGTACSAPNWNSCVWIQVYNNGEGPYPTGATSTGASTSTLAAAAPSNFRAPNFVLPSVIHPVIKNVRYAFGAKQAQLVLSIKAGGVTRRLIQAYGRRHLANSLDMLVTVNGKKSGLGVNIIKHVPLRVYQPTGIVRVPLTFRHKDILAIRQALKKGQTLDIDIQVKQHVQTPHEMFEMPRVKRVRYHN